MTATAGAIRSSGNRCRRQLAATRARHGSCAGKGTGSAAIIARSRSLSSILLMGRGGSAAGASALPLCAAVGLSAALSEQHVRLAGCCAKLVQDCVAGVPRLPLAGRGVEDVAEARLVRVLDRTPL